jgi:hypothetical protein
MYMGRTREKVEAKAFAIAFQGPPGFTIRIGLGDPADHGSLGHPTISVDIEDHIAPPRREQVEGGCEYILPIGDDRQAQGHHNASELHRLTAGLREFRRLKLTSISLEQKEFTATGSPAAFPGPTQHPSGEVDPEDVSSLANGLAKIRLIRTGPTGQIENRISGPKLGCLDDFRSIAAIHQLDRMVVEGRKEVVPEHRYLLW